MIRSSSHFVIFMILISFILTNSCSNSGKKSTASLNTFKDKAARMADQAKTGMIQTAVHAYIVEFGQPPQSLDELVEKRYLNPEDILDHSGKKIPFSADEFSAGSDSFITKSCGACGKSVSSGSKVGDRCPHCGVIWGSERQIGG